MYAVFNSANADSAISSKRPQLRILALNVTMDEAREIEKKQSIETRIWEMSNADFNWRSISNLNFIGLELSKIETMLLQEYQTFDARVSDWNFYRAQKEVDVVQARSKRRTVHQIHAEHLLYSNKMPKVEQTTTVASIKRDEELRGQNWALIAIIGDANAEALKENIINKLGLSYMNHLRLHIGIDIDIEMPENQDALLFAFNNLDAEKQEQIKANFSDDVYSAHRDLDSIVCEPLVAFFASAEKPEDLEKKSDELSKLESLKNADIAIVRMYSWLNLSKVNTVKAKHVARDPRANEFFSSMRSMLQ
jgi:hypothetical protein